MHMYKKYSLTISSGPALELSFVFVSQACLRLSPRLTKLQVLDMEIGGSSFLSLSWQCEFFRFFLKCGEDQRSAGFKVLNGFLYRVASVTFQLRFTKRYFPGCDPALTSAWTGIHGK